MKTKYVVGEDKPEFKPERIIEWRLEPGYGEDGMGLWLLAEDDNGCVRTILGLHPKTGLTRFHGVEGLVPTDLSGVIKDDT